MTHRKLLSQSLQRLNKISKFFPNSSCFDMVIRTHSYQLGRRFFLERVLKSNFGSSCKSSGHFSSDTKNDNESEIASMINQIEKTVKESDIVIFMKGKPSAPECGYSKAAIMILSRFQVKNIAAVNVLENDVLRSAIKKYTSWPTIPQIFIKGEFIGGSDILTQMYQSGELHKRLVEKGILDK